MRTVKYFFLFCLLPLAGKAQLSNQLNLDDVQIKGEASGSKLLNISSRKKNNIADRINMKSSLISDILEDLPLNYTAKEPLKNFKKK